MKEIWYRADYDYVPENYGGGDSEYFCLNLEKGKAMKDLDKEAVKIAKEIAKDGKDFADVGHTKMDLVELYEVDGEQECFPDVRLVWW